MNKLNYIFIAVIAILLAIVFTRQTETVTITVPEKTGEFVKDSSQLKPIVLTDTIVEKGKDIIIEVPNPVNTDLLKKYEAATDSLEQLKLYKDAVTERTYKETYTDSTQSITVESEVIGTLVNQKVSYTIPPTTIPVQIKKPRLSVYAGLQTTINTRHNFTPTLTLATPKVLYTTGYNINEKAVTVGLAYKLF